MSNAGKFVYEKRPNEIVPLAVDFVNVVPNTETADSKSSSIKAYDSSGVEVSSTLIDGTTLSAYKLTAKVKAGTDGQSYKIVYKLATSTSGYIWEEIVLLMVSDAVS